MANNLTENTTETQLQQNVNDFYEYIAKCLNDYIIYVSSLNTIDNNKYKSFIDYWCYQLYGNYGIKRKIIKYTYPDEKNKKYSKDNHEFIYGNNVSTFLIQFFYDKSLSGYDKSKSITRLCRHMLFDVNSFSIVSLGITKAMYVDDFYKSLIPNIENDLLKYSVVIEEFLEGTMLIYNPGMSRFNYNIMSKKEDEDENDENSDKNTKNTKNLTVSTRRKIGTSYFNKPGKTFYEMFQENNKISNIDLSIITDNDINNICLIFNVEHNDNRIISPNITNRNTLVGAFMFKPIDNNLQIMEYIMSRMHINKNMCDDNIKINIEFKDDENNIINLDDILTVISKNMSDKMVTDLNISYIRETMKNKYDIELNIPKIYKVMYNTREEIEKFVNEEIEKLNIYSPGIIIYDKKRSSRYKIRKSTYTEILNLKGNIPISMHNKNNKNLFKCYWRLRKAGNNSVYKFLKIFDTENQEYKKLFENYKKLIHEFTHNLYIEYITVFVDKEKHARDIQYIYAPLIGDLHTNYKKTHEPTTKFKVVNYVNNLPVYKIYWRLFNAETVTKEYSYNMNKVENTTE